MGSVPSPLSSAAFFTLPLLQAFLLQGCWAGAATPAFSSQLVHLVLWEIAPPLSLVLRVPLPFCYVSFVVVVVYSVCFFFFFPWVGVSLLGVMLIWTRAVCGNTTCHLAHLVVCFSQASRSWCLEVRVPSRFLHLPWSGDAVHGLVVWWCQSFTSSWWFFL
jgi:hypothetical protein